MPPSFLGFGIPRHLLTKFSISILGNSSFTKTKGLTQSESALYMYLTNYFVSKSLMSRFLIKIDH